MKRILTAVLGLALLAAPAAAFARGGGHGGGGHAGGGFHGGGGFHAAPAAGFHGGFHAAAPYGGFRGPAVRVGPGFRGPVVGVRPVGGRVFIPGYWGFRGGVRVWIGPGWSYAPYDGWNWVSPHWAWNGYTWVWQQGYWAPPVY
jgi:hypothetical protein